MTDYIKEMMKAAAVEPERIVKMGLSGWRTKIRENYPTFTPEKQIKIFQLIHQADFIDCIVSYFNELEKVYVFKAFTVCELSSEQPTVYYVQNQDFPQALAQLTTELMKAGELDKEKVKEILEG